MPINTVYKYSILLDMKVLPTFYYLTHFDQSLSYIADHCISLLDPEQQTVLIQLQGLPKLERALVARILNRNASFISVESLNYPELENLTTLLDGLIKQGFIRIAHIDDIPTLAGSLTKVQLYELSHILAPNTAKSSWPKVKLLSHIQAQSAVARPCPSLAAFLSKFVYRSVEKTFNYFLFLFFGHLNGQLKQFSLRDLGIIRTREDIQPMARFNSQIDAWSCYRFEYAYQQLRDENNDIYNLRDIDNIEYALPPISGLSARDAANRYFVELAKKVFADIPKKAIQILAYATSAGAFEKRIRLLYHSGEHEQVQTLLETAIDSPDSDEQLIFSEDFLARKFHKKRRSIYTDLLHAQQHQIYIDESAKNRIEHQVVQQYRQKGIEAWRTENHCWRCLFGLLFWDILFESTHNGLCNEFDRSPKALNENTFWSDKQKVINQRLSLLDTPETLQTFLVAQMAQHHAKSNPIFRWHANILETVSVLTHHATTQALKTMLRFMCQNYSTYKDGFPDIALLQSGDLIFEELKAPGDSLRKNQLVTIRALKAAGFSVRITRVGLIRDYNARYAVVDIETTGGSKAAHRVTEIGIVFVEQQKVIERWSQLINPQRLIPKNITSLTGITNEMVADQPLFSDIAETLKSKLEGCIFAAHNVNFDYGFIQAEFNRLDEHIALPNVCTVRECRRQFPGLPSYSLANLSQHFQIKLDQHHRALADAQAAADLLLKVFGDELSQLAQTC